MTFSHLGEVRSVGAKNKASEKGGKRGSVKIFSWPGSHGGKKFRVSAGRGPEVQARREREHAKSLVRVPLLSSHLCLLVGGGRGDTDYTQSGH